MSWRAFTLATLAAIALPSLASAAPVSAQLDRPETTVGDPVVLTVTVEGSGAGEPRLPELPAFDVVSRGQSSEMQIVNGRVSSRVVYEFSLEPRQAGTLAIPPVHATVGGRAYASETLSLHVLPAGQRARAGEDAFVTASVSNPEPYAGELVVYTFRFYRRVRVLGTRFQPPDLSAFGAESLGDQIEGTATENGLTYSVTELKQALFFDRPGTVTIPPAALVVELEARGGGRRGIGGFDDPFGDFFGRTRSRARTLRTGAVEVRVRPLPPAPAGFSGLVGTFQVHTAIGKRTLKVGESTTLTVTVSGKGNVRGVPEPHLGELAGIRLYDDKPETEVHPVGDTLAGTTVFKKALVPREAGALTFPAIELPYFDPSRGEYATATSEPITLEVAPGDAAAPVVVGAPAAAPAAAKRAVEIVGDDILPIHARARLWSANERRLAGRLAGAGLALPPLAFVLVLLAARRRERLGRDSALLRRRGALARGKKGLAAARGLAAGDPRAALTAAERCLKSLIGDELDVPGLALTAVELERHLATRAVPPELVRRAADELRALEAASYGATGTSEADALARLHSIEALMREIDRAARAA